MTETNSDRYGRRMHDIISTLNRPWAKIPAFVALAYASVALTAWTMQDRLIYPGAYMDLPQPIANEKTNGRISGTMLPGPDGAFFALHAAPAKGMPVIIEFHGNGMYPENFGRISSDLVRIGAGVIAPAYPGYPRSPGHPSEVGIHAMASAAYDWARKTYPDSPVVALGHSLGSGPAVRLAAHRKVAGLILLAPFLSVASVASEAAPFLPVDLLLSSPFRSDLEIPKVTAPVLTLHGEMDRVIPIAAGETLTRLSKAKAEFVKLDIVDHFRILTDAGAIGRIRSFVAEVAASRSDPGGEHYPESGKEAK